MRTVFHSDSEESLQQPRKSRQPPMATATSTQTSRSDVTVLPPDHPKNPDRRQSDAAVEAPAERMSLRQVPSHTRDSAGQTPENLSFAASPQPSSRPTPSHIDTAKDLGATQSPPLPANDSAYSSVSDSSFASPLATAIPRCASSQSLHTPRAQFGLFPSSTPSTPKLTAKFPLSGGLSVRHGTLSPSPMSKTVVEEVQMQQPVMPPARSQSSMTNHSSASSSSRRLLKKGSLSSIKRLFSKRKNVVDSIAE